MITVRTKCLKTEDIEQLITAFEEAKTVLIRNNARPLVLSNIGLTLNYLYDEYKNRSKSE